MTVPSPSVRATLSATFFANHGSWASCRARLAARRAHAAGKVGAVLGERAGATDVAEPGADAQLAQDRERHADRRERVVDQQRAAVGDPRAPLGDVAPRWRVPVRTVDVEHVDRIADLGMRRLRERADVTDPIRDPGRGEVGVERLVVAGGLGLESDELLRTAIVAGVRIDGDHLDTVRRRRGEDDRRLAPEAADLDDPTAGRASRRGREQPPALLRRVIQPSTAATDSAMSS